MKNYLKRYWRKFSYTGLVVGVIFFALSLTPSLIPRGYWIQGVVSGTALVVGYGFGSLLYWLWSVLELPKFKNKAKKNAKYIFATFAGLFAVINLIKTTDWQNSIRILVEVPPVNDTHALKLVIIAILFAIILLWISRLFKKFYNFLSKQLHKIISKRAANVLGSVLVVFITITLVTGVLGEKVLDWLDASFSQVDEMTEDGIEMPTDIMRSGSSESLIAWETIGRRGKNFVAQGPYSSQIEGFNGSSAFNPLRAYVGVRTADTLEERAEIALDELKRINAFDRKVLVIATPTGTGWIDGGAADTLEYMHNGDTAIFGVQYSYLPSWLTLLVSPEKAKESSEVVFTKIYNYWTTLPEDERPMLYLHGLSLGAYGSEASASLFQIFKEPIDGALWAGPPFPSSIWSTATNIRNPESPAWLPTINDSSLLRFTGMDNSLNISDKEWGKMRMVYMQHPSDPMVFFSPDILFKKPDWLIGERGPDVSEDFNWYPVVTFVQTMFDLPIASTITPGHGHRYRAEEYINGWVAVSNPENWTEEDTERLKELF